MPDLFQGMDSPNAANTFELCWWPVVPRKKGKAAARKAFAAAVARIERAGESRQDALDVLLVGVNRWATQARDHLKSGGDAKHIPHPSTWLNQGRWEDEDDPAPIHVDPNAYTPPPEPDQPSQAIQHRQAARRAHDARPAADVEKDKARGRELLERLRRKKAK